MDARILFAFLASTSLVASGAAHAQAPQQSAPSGNAGGLEEIVVTAQRREQKLQSVPISITALSAESLKANRIETVGDLNAIAPNLTVRPGAGGNQSPNYTLRGILGASSAAGQDKGVSPYLDGVYLQAQSGSLFELADIERIEVLKGPQGTLFGRNATGGAIQIVTKDPTGEFGGYQELSGGNYGIFRTKTHLELPAWGPVSAYITYLHSQREGDTKNLGAGTRWNYLDSGAVHGIRTSPETLGDTDANAVMGAVKYKTEEFQLSYRFDYSHNDFTPNAEGVAYLPPSLVANLYAVSPNPMTPVTNRRPDAVNNWFATPSFQENWGHNVTAQYWLNDDVSFKNILSQRMTRLATTFQLDGVGGLTNVPVFLAPGAFYPPGFIPLGPGGNPNLASFVKGAPFIFLGNNAYDREWQWSEEFQVNVTKDWMTLTAGYLHFYNHITSGGFTDGYNTTITQVIAGQNTALKGSPFVIPANPGYKGNTVQTFSNALYAQPEFHLTEKLDLQVGLRWTQDIKNGHEDYPDQQLSPGSSPIQYKHSQFTYLAGLNYKLDRDTLLYAKYSTGYVSGGSLATLSYKPEKARSWELGVKTEQFDNRLRSNLALFDARYSNLQYDTSGSLTGLDSTKLFAQAVVNQGDAHALGFELENIFAATPHLTFTANLGYTNFKYEQATIPPNLASVSGPPGFKPFQRPNFTGTLGAQYTSDELWRGSHLTARIDANFRSETLMTSNTVSTQSPTVSDPDILRAANSPFVWLVNTRVALSEIDLGATRAEVALWSKNLLDEREIVQYVGLGLVGSVIYEPARTFGVDVRFDF